jgi:hypothetical protein
MKNKDFNSMTSKIVTDTYNKMDNYFINQVSEKKLAVVYFSSNGIYYPNEYDIFKEYIIEENKFEWTKEGWKLEEAGLNIYIRDIYKQWYVNGINKDINSIDKLVDFINILTKGYKVITVGSSAGGFIATLIGCKINAKYIFNFAGQFDLTFQSIYNDLLVDYLRKNTEYANLKTIVENSKSKVFYFVGSNSFIDARDIQVAHSIRSNIYIFQFNQNIHGIPFILNACEELIKKNEYELEQLYLRYKGKIINRYIFEIYLIGLLDFIKIYMKKLKIKITGKNNGF